MDRGRDPSRPPTRNRLGPTTGHLPREGLSTDACQAGCIRLEVRAEGNDEQLRGTPSRKHACSPTSMTSTFNPSCQGATAIRHNSTGPPIEFWTDCLYRVSTHAWSTWWDEEFALVAVIAGACDEGAAVTLWQAPRDDRHELGSSAFPLESLPRMEGVVRSG